MKPEVIPDSIVKAAEDIRHQLDQHTSGCLGVVIVGMRRSKARMIMHLVNSVDAETPEVKTLPCPNNPTNETGRY